MMAQGCLRSIHSLGIRRLAISPPLSLWYEQRAFYAKPKQQEEQAKKATKRIKVKDAPKSNYTTRRGIRGKKKTLQEIALEKQKLDPSLKKPKKEKPPKAATKSYEDEGESTTPPKKGLIETEENDIRPGDFLFQYARYNLGHQALTRPISLPVREAMWQLYDADHVC